MFIDTDPQKFTSRDEAGKLLAKKLKRLKENALVLAVPRGGVVVGAHVARVLKCPLDVIIIRKLGAPGNPELAIGATTSKGGILLDKELVNKLNISPEYIAEEKADQITEAKRREALYVSSDRTDFTGKTAILVDDGIATGSTIEAAINALRSELPEKIVVAAPVAPPATLDRLAREADEVVVLETPEPFYAIGEFYSEFPQVSDEEVIDLLQENQPKTD